LDSYLRPKKQLTPAETAAFLAPRLLHNTAVLTEQK
jgi:hypothetical protein